MGFYGGQTAMCNEESKIVHDPTMKTALGHTQFRNGLTHRKNGAINGWLLINNNNYTSPLPADPPQSRRQFHK